ncbi:hypothetical protein [Sporolactobacillus nakayamae]|nr:hypothetical protein [Sporolactobacillus nakayamae]
MNNGKEAFMHACAEAISALDTSSTHYLFELKNGEQVYQAKTDHLSMVNEDGSSAKLIGMLPPVFIRSYHAAMHHHSDHAENWIHQELEKFLTAFNDPNYCF